MRLRIMILVAGLVSGLSASAQAQMSHTEMNHSDMDHGAMHASPAAASALPSEPGQGAFAAISEIVAMLVADPKTDWSRVDIGALRAHLVDMDNLVTRTLVETRDISGGIEMIIDKTGPDEGADLRMVPAHAPVLAGETGWTSEVTDTGDHLVWRVVSDADETKIHALGFFGLMATGDHHRAHHLAIATGKPMH